MEHLRAGIQKDKTLISTGRYRRFERLVGAFCRTPGLGFLQQRQHLPGKKREKLSPIVVSYTHAGKVISGNLRLVAGNRYVLQLNGSAGASLVFRASSEDVKATLNCKNPRQPELILEASAKVRKSTQVIVKPEVPGNPAATNSLIQLTLSVEVLPVLTAEPKLDEPSALLCMFLAEAQTPENKKLGPYVPDQVQKSMRWMRQVLENQLELSPVAFGVKKDAGKATLIDMLKAPNNVAGFNHYPLLAPGVMRTIDDILSAANDANNNAFDGSRKHAEIALFESQHHINDCPVKIYSWRTARSSSPGKNYCLYSRLAGQDYYTLRPEWIDALQKTQKHWESNRHEESATR